MDSVTRLLEAAETLARTHLRTIPRGGLGGVRETEICMECQRARTYSGHVHAPSCPVGPVLELCDRLRNASGMSLTVAEYARGFADGQARTLQQIADDVQVRASERASAVRRLEAAVGPAPGASAFCECETGACNHSRSCKQTDGLGAFRVAGFKQTLCSHCQQTAKTYCESAREPFEPIPEALPERRVVCGRGIVVFGHPGRDVFTCDLEPGHGDAWHEDKVVGHRWSAAATEIHFHPSGLMETRLLGSEREFTRIADSEVFHHGV